jgi:hypothetical protein
MRTAENLSGRRFAEYLSLSQVPDAKPDGSPPEAAPSSERWVAPDQDLIPRAVADVLSEKTFPQNHSVTSMDPDKDPVIAGQLRAPRRWERLLVETAVIGGRERWQKGSTALGRIFALDLRRSATRTKQAVGRFGERLQIWERSQLMRYRSSTFSVIYPSLRPGAYGSIVWEPLQQIPVPDVNKDSDHAVWNFWCGASRQPASRHADGPRLS